MEEEEKFAEWSGLDEDEKRKYNGYNGFVKGELFSCNNAFMCEDKDRRARKLQKERERRGK